jgi:diaminohydroxyphosphoribosylaminopyrimidine deaminase/5-amino-6-(5-phosphoribosylamino)uracil reductase
MDTKDEIYHQRCLELAQKGLGLVAPNPMVGSVVVFEDRIIGEGYHAIFGGPHAEVTAINSVKDKSKLKKATLYVNLEPCTHFGKTPPCIDLIIKNKIPRVVIGQRDPYIEVAGKGIEKLISEGIEVHVGFLENECRYLNKRFLTFHEKKRPYVILKWAETNDGYIDYKRNSVSDSQPVWITDEVIRPLIHKWRSEEQAILVGTNTALLDNPKLTVREWAGKSPLRMVLDRHLRLPDNLNLFNKSQPTVVFTEKKSKNSTNLEFHIIDFQNLIDEIFNFCYVRKIQSILVEGGAQLINTFIQNGKWDEARVFKSDKCFGKGVEAPKINKIPENKSLMENSILYSFYNY